MVSNFPLGSMECTVLTYQRRRYSWPHRSNLFHLEAEDLYRVAHQNSSYLSILYLLLRLVSYARDCTSLENLLQLVELIWASTNLLAQAQTTMHQPHSVGRP